MSKHTPGPWEIERYSEGLIQIVGNIRAVSDHEEHVTTVVEAVTRGDEANAKLIVAAPDLLDALVALVECEQTTPELWEAARAAIAKATA
ncbi:hypothetical protein [Pseudomonas aeruginosa]|uniref:hypothetical protein n=1 Tax=Pseudomonas aeruginosa TaxID=287 RepID=UPI000B495EBC|nr:hypothetical protein [Pseudomonas aeruginosa]OWI73472.1 hypothetical protein CDC22_27190 [Pseudomonas aeruginosa]